MTLLALSSSSVLSPFFNFDNSTLACSSIAASEDTWPTSADEGMEEGMELERGDLSKDLSLVKEGFVILVPPKERVFWAPFAAGPLESRERRVGGIFDSVDWFFVRVGVGFAQLWLSEERLFEISMTIVEVGGEIRGWKGNLSKRGKMGLGCEDVFLKQLSVSNLNCICLSYRGAGF